MDWNDLRYLLAVHRHRSLAGAATALKVTKATVSRRIAALEEALGVRVAERKPDGLVLTDAGREAGLGGMPGFEWLRDEDHGARVAFRANDPEALVGAATAGLGLCAVPCLLADSEPVLKRVTALGFSRCVLHLVTHQEVQRTARIRVVTDFLVELAERHRQMLEG